MTGKIIQEVRDTTSEILLFLNAKEKTAMTRVSYYYHQQVEKPKQWKTVLPNGKVILDRENAFLLETLIDKKILYADDQNTLRINNLELRKLCKENSIFAYKILQASSFLTELLSPEEKTLTTETSTPKKISGAIGGSLAGILAIPLSVPYAVFLALCTRSPFQGLRIITSSLPLPFLGVYQGWRRGMTSNIFKLENTIADQALQGERELRKYNCKN